MTTPTYGFPYPTLADAPNGPGAFEALAEAVDAELSRVESGLGVPYHKALRGSTNTFPGGSFQSLGIAASIGAAPAGVYLLSWNFILSSDAVRTGNLRVTVNGTTVNADARADLAAFAQGVSGAMPHLHAAAGDLTATAAFQFPSGTATVHAGSHIALVRIGDAP